MTPMFLPDDPQAQLALDQLRNLSIAIPVAIRRVRDAAARAGGLGGEEAQGEYVRAQEEIRELYALRREARARARQAGATQRMIAAVEHRGGAV